MLFCNGPQCAATPDAIRTLLRAGYPAERLAYYRGGIHDWVTLGLPLEPAEERSASGARDDLTNGHRVMRCGCGGLQRAAGRPAASQAFIPPSMLVTSSRWRAARRAASVLR